MNHNKIALSLMLLTTHQALPWEWPMSFKLGWFGSRFMNKEEKYFNNLITRIEKEKATQASPKFGSFQQDPDKPLASSLLIKSYEKNLKRLMTPINDDDENLKKLKMILRKNLSIHGALTILAEENITTPKDCVNALKERSRQFDIGAPDCLNIKKTDRVQPTGPEAHLAKQRILPQLTENYVNKGYRELHPDTTLDDENSFIESLHARKNKEFATLPLLQEFSRDIALSYIEELQQLKPSIDTHNKSVEKNKTLYTALLKKHGIKLD